MRIEGKLGNKYINIMLNNIKRRGVKISQYVEVWKLREKSKPRKLLKGKNTIVKDFDCLLLEIQVGGTTLIQMYYMKDREGSSPSSRFFSIIEICVFDWGLCENYFYYCNWHKIHVLICWWNCAWCVCVNLKFRCLCSWVLTW